MPKLSQELFRWIVKSAVFSLIAYGIYFVAISFLSTHSFFLNFPKHPIIYLYGPRSDILGLFFVPYIPIFAVAFFFSLIYGICVINSYGKLFSAVKAVIFSFLMSAITALVSVGIALGFLGISASNISFGIPFQFGVLRIASLFYTTISYIFYPFSLVYDILFWFAFFITLFVIRRFSANQLKLRIKLFSEWR